MTESTGRLPGLDLLRAIAIVWVMLFHAYIVGGFGDAYPLTGLIAQHGWMGVDLFFLLSGYLIGSQLLKVLSRAESLALGEFYRRRAFRVLPAFLAVLALYFLWPAFREEAGIQPLWQFLTFTVNLLIDYGHNRAFSHVWSLCVEEHFYLLFPLLAWWLTRRPSRAKFFSAVVGVVVCGMAIRGAIWLHELAPDVDGFVRGFGERFIEDIYYPTYTRLDGLLAGVVLATIRWYRPALWQRMEANADRLLLIGIAVTALAIALFGERTGFATTVIGYPVLSAGLAMIVAAGASRRGALARVVVPGAEWLAAASYSLYLIHKPVYRLVEQFLLPGSGARGVAAFAIYAVVALTAGALLHRVVERPFLRLRDASRPRTRTDRQHVTANGPRLERDPS